MEIRIVQKRWNLIFDQYEVFLNDQLKYKAKSKLFSFLSKISMFDLKENEICTIIKDQDFSNHLNYTIEYRNGVSKIQSESFIEYFIRNSKGTLSFYEQKGNLIGIFLNDKQIGTLNKNTRKILGQDKYQIKYEKGEVDPINLIGFAIAYDIENNNKSSGVVNWDFGNVVIDPTKKVDPNWEPRE